VVKHLMGRPAGQDALAPLSPRERETLELMAEGRTNHGIAGIFGVTERAVEKNVTSIFEKLGLQAAPDDHRRVLAVLTYLRS
jgi:DNA-binding NarL/FixJ family response regulator